MDIKNRKVEMFRCHLDPAIGVKPKQAFTVGVEGINAAELTPIGIWVEWVHTSPGTNDRLAKEHIVPFSNVQSIRLAPDNKDAK